MTLGTSGSGATFDTAGYAVTLSGSAIRSRRAKNRPRHPDAGGQQHLQRRHDDLGRHDLVEQRQRRCRTAPSPSAPTTACSSTPTAARSRRSTWAGLPAAAISALPTAVMRSRSAPAATGPARRTAARSAARAGLTKAGGGTLVLCGSNTYTGGTTIAAGTLKLDFSQAARRRPTSSTTRPMPLPWPWAAAPWRSKAMPARPTANSSTA